MNCKHNIPLRQSCHRCREEIAQKKTGPFWLKNAEGDRRALGKYEGPAYKYEG